jgi:hypothetical protein
MMISSPGSAAAFYLVKPPVHAFEVATSHAAIGPVHRCEGYCAWSPAWARAHKMKRTVRREGDIGHFGCWGQVQPFLIASLVSGSGTRKSDERVS